MERPNIFKMIGSIPFLFASFVLCASVQETKHSAEPFRASTLFSSIRPSSSDSLQEKTVQLMIRRIVPAISNKFVIHVSSTDNRCEQESYSTGDFVKLVTIGDKIHIYGSSGVSAAYGFHHYLKYYCKAHISWNGDQLKLPSSLPNITEPIKLRSPYRFRYYQNVCTSSYSFVWWNWTRWEKEIDWMALNGINLPLAFTGQEAIWRKVYLHIGLTEEEIQDHFAGPAFLAWQRMGNIQRWGGPLSKLWLERQLNLQHKILQRMRSFGMIPVLPAFAGHVPDSLKQIFPNSTYTRFSSWSHFKRPYCCTLFLDPRDALFQKISQLFIQYQQQEYNGTDHVYSVDLFNEMIPTSSSVTYLESVSSSVWKSLEMADENAIWLMQSWFFNFFPSFWKPEQIDSFLAGVPQGKLLILDLYAEQIPLWKKTNFFSGHAFIWCLLNNFGGTYGLVGSLENITRGPLEALKAKNSTIVGLGMTPEGIGRNYVAFDLMSEMGWQKQRVVIEEWIKEYAIRRYGTRSTFSVKAWITMSKTVYDYSANDIKKNIGLLVQLPRFGLKRTKWYKDIDMQSTWRSLLRAAKDAADVPTYRFDLIDVGRQVLEDLSHQFYKKVCDGYLLKSTLKIKKYGYLLLDIVKDLDKLFATDRNFLLGVWLEDAKACANSTKEKTLYEFNARNQITVWGPTGDVLDYASKEWSGLMESYYLPRWQMFVDFLLDAVLHKRTFNQTYFNSLSLDRGIKWTMQRDFYPVHPVGHVIRTSSLLLKKYEIYFLRV